MKIMSNLQLNDNSVVNVFTQPTQHGQDTTQREFFKSNITRLNSEPSFI